MGAFSAGGFEYCTVSTLARDACNIGRGLNVPDSNGVVGGGHSETPNHDVGIASCEAVACAPADSEIAASSDVRRARFVRQVFDQFSRDLVRPYFNRCDPGQEVIGSAS